MYYFHDVDVGSLTHDISAKKTLVIEVGSLTHLTKSISCEKNYFSWYRRWLADLRDFWWKEIIIFIQFFYILILDTFKCHSWLFQDNMRSLVPFSMLSVHLSWLSGSAALVFSHHVLIIIVLAISLLQHIHWFDEETIDNNFSGFMAHQNKSLPIRLWGKKGLWV